MGNCIYCNREAHSVEHPLPAALGSFDNTPTLLDRICKECNEHAIGVLDEQFIRCGPAALLRKRFGIEGRRHHGQVNPFYRGSAGGNRIKLYGWDEACKSEVLLELMGGNEARQLTQLIIYNRDGTQNHIPLTSKMTSEHLLQAIRQQKLTPEIDIRLVWDPATEPWAVDLVKKLWPNVTMPEPSRGADSFQGATAQFQTTSRYFRAIAKIGFHYFLTQTQDFCGQESIFEGIRKFVLTDDPNVVPQTINRHIGQHRIPVALGADGYVVHILCAETRNRHLYAHLAPFITPDGAMPSYCIYLGKASEPIADTAKAHIYKYNGAVESAQNNGSVKQIDPRLLNLDLRFIQSVLDRDAFRSDRQS